MQSAPFSVTAPSSQVTESKQSPPLRTLPGSHDSQIVPSLLQVPDPQLGLQETGAGVGAGVGEGATRQSRPYCDFRSSSTNPAGHDSTH